VRLGVKKTIDAESTASEDKLDAEASEQKTVFSLEWLNYKISEKPSPFAVLTQAVMRALVAT